MGGVSLIDDLAENAHPRGQGAGGSWGEALPGVAVLGVEALGTLGA